MGFLTALLASIVCILGVSYIAKLRQRHIESHANGCQPPKKYPHSDPFLGLDLFFKTGKLFEENRYLFDLLERYGKLGRTFETNLLGSPSINTIEPRNLQTIYVTKFVDWGVQPVRLPAQEPFCGRGFITTDGAQWEHTRALLKPSFNKANVDLASLERGLQLVLSRIPRDGSVVDLQPLFLQLYLDTATSFLFGESFDSLAGTVSDVAENFMKAFDYAMLGSGFRIALGRFKILWPTRQWLKSCQITHSFVDQYVDKALEYRSRFLTANKVGASAQQSNLTVGQNLLYAMAEQTGDRTSLRNECLQAMMAAQETTAVLVSNSVFLLARHENVWHRLRSEVLTLDPQNLDANAVQSLKYLQQVLNETLRLYPVFPQMSRVALNDTTLPLGGGPDGKSPIFVRAGTMFDTAFFVLHRLPSIWGADAEKFIPERWNSFKPQTWEYVPFGGGPRGCAGRYKALTEASYIIVRILHEFKSIESRDEREWTGQVQLTAKNVHGCKVALTPA